MYSQRIVWSDTAGIPPPGKERGGTYRKGGLEEGSEFWLSKTIFLNRFERREGERYLDPAVADSEGAEEILPPPPKICKRRKSVLISLILHICWSKMQNFLGSLRSPALLNNLFKAYLTLKYLHIHPPFILHDNYGCDWGWEIWHENARFLGPKIA